MDNKHTQRPLADRIRPKGFDEIAGQAHLVGKGGIIRKLVENGRIPNMIFYGPPGTGKTTVANIIADASGMQLFKLNATTASVADVKDVLSATDGMFSEGGTLLYLDEIQSFNKKQQQSLLEFMENGKITLIASTTENPYASMTPAIVSRCRVFELKRIPEEDIKISLIRALHDKERGLGNLSVTVTDDALNHIAKVSAGDLRVAYNALELAVLTTSPNKDGQIEVTLKDAEESIQQKALSFDEQMYYDMLSAFCKSLRGSDSDAALYWAQRLIKGGCDPLLILRRVIAHSAEDVGLADPMALVVATNALVAFEKMGLPEGMLPLSEAIIYVCEADKSNAVVMAMDASGEDAVNIKDDTVPSHLKNAVYGSKQDKDFSKNYKYPHNYGGYVDQQYLPDTLKGKKYYYPTDNGYESKIKEIRKRKGKA